MIANSRQRGPDTRKWYPSQCNLFLTLAMNKYYTKNIKHANMGIWHEMPLRKLMPNFKIRKGSGHNLGSELFIYVEGKCKLF